VAIRTLQAQLSENQVRYDVGSGVVWDSQADTEYAECLQKAEALRPPPPRPALLETMLYQPGKGVWLLEHHLKRLRETALFMGYADPSTRAEQLLRALDHGQEMRVRLVYDPNAHLHEAHGDPFDLHCAPLSELRPPAGQPLRIRLDTEATPSSVRLLYIKTTSRGVYDTARARHPDVDDVLLWNERGELTESTIANLALCIDGRWITPRVSCGLLAGCYRAELLEQGWMSEGILTRDDLARASEILLLNSVRGKIAVTWVP
jgi:para-aminobenzoate synthetase/4-amino-4-deoxychorismate lyase